MTNFVVMKLENKSPYRRGAEFGFIFGAVFTLMLFSSIYLLTHPIFGFLPTLLTIGCPIILYILLRKSYVADNGETTYFSLVVTGLSSFFCGGFICGLIAMFHIRFFDPSVISKWITEMVQMYRAIKEPAAQEMADKLQNIIDLGMLPSPAEMGINIIWTAITVGIILSAILAFAATIKKVNKRK